MGSVIFRVYQGLGRMAAPLLVGLYKWRARQGKEDQTRRGERFGVSSIERPDGQLIWIHAASVGETNAVLPLVKQVQDSGCTVLLTTTTLTSAEIVKASAPQGVIHQFVPYDTRGNIKRFLNHWDPYMAITVESEIWPATFHELQKRLIPLIIVNGRISENSFSNWNRVPGFSRSIFGNVDCVLAQSEEDALRFKELGAKRVRSTGNIKFDGNIPQCNPEELAQLKAKVAKRPHWLAASTHPGEEAKVAKAHKKLQQNHADLLTVIAPRHPKRSAEIEEELKRHGLVCAVRSRGDEITAETDVYLADTLGELGLFYRLCPIVFMGGSLEPIGGHNLLEPAQIGCAVISGKHTQNFSWIYRYFSKNDGVVLIEDEQELATQVATLLQDQARVSDLAAKANALVKSGRGALAATSEAIAEYLPPNQNSEMGDRT